MSHEPLRNARKAAGISLSAMAEIIGFDKGNLSRIESGKTKHHKVLEIATLYDIALGNEPYTLVYECEALPANLRSATSPIPGYVCRLMPNSLPDRPSATVTGRLATFRRTMADSVLSSVALA